MQNPTEALFTLALNLTPPWICTGIDFSKEASRLDITIDFPRGSRFSCPECGATHLALHDTTEKQWRHLDFFQHVCYLHARVPRITCPEHGTRLVAVPWARPGSGFTLLFEALALVYAQNMAIRPASRQLRIHDTMLWRIVTHYVAMARAEVDYHEVTSLAVDETSRRRGYQYVTIVADPDRQRVLFATQGKDKAAVGRFVQDFHDHNGDPDAVREICMDMSPAYIEAVLEALPNASITYDRFHVMKLANDALDGLRRAEAHDDTSLKGTRYLFLKRFDSLTKAQEATLLRTPAMNDRMARGWRLVYNLRLFYEVPIEHARVYLRHWYNWAIRSRLGPFRTLARTINTHWHGILNYHRTRMTTGFMEGLNSVIQAAKRKARGYRSAENFITIIYLIAGKLPLRFTHSI
jgi:transposase